MSGLQGLDSDAVAGILDVERRAFREGAGDEPTTRIAELLPRTITLPKTRQPEAEESLEPK